MEYLANVKQVELSHWLMIAGGILVIVGAIGTLVSGRRRGAAPRPDREDADELREWESKP